MNIHKTIRTASTY